MRLKEIREEKGLTQKELAKKINVSPSNIYNYEVGRTEPSIDMLLILSNALDVTVDYLIGATPEEFGATLSKAPAPMRDALTQDEQDLLTAFNKLGPFKRDFFLNQIKATAEQSQVIKK